MTDVFQIIAVTTLILAFLLGVIAIIVAPQGKGSSISGSIASHRLLFTMSGIVITVLAVLFSLSIYYWYKPTYSMPDYTAALAVLCLILALPIAWAPADATKNPQMRNLHFAAGQALGAVLLAILGLALLSNPNEISMFSQLFIYLTLGYSVLCYYLYNAVPKLKKYFLYFEAPFLAALVISFLLLALQV